jgi:hypothetical protein
MEVGFAVLEGIVAIGHEKMEMTAILSFPAVSAKARTRHKSCGADDERAVSVDERPGGRVDGVRSRLDLPGIQDRHFLKLRQLGIPFLAAAGLRTGGEGRFKAPK